MQTPSGVLFDFGDTILNVESFDPAAGRKKLLEFAKNASHLTIEDIQRSADDIYGEVNRIKEESLIEVAWQILDRLLFETLGVSFNISYSELEKECWQAGVKMTPADGIVDVLDTLEKNKIKTGIISNTIFSGAVLEEELTRHNLAHRFSFIISSADYGFRKPHNRIFQIAVSKMNLKTQDIWFVGDKLDYDVKGAFNYGLYPVWYNPQNKSGKSDYEYLEIRDWYQFQNKIESLCNH
jgi:putative hydrolase of the HAD superfamily